jgi:hypothetical protein
MQRFSDAIYKTTKIPVLKENKTILELLKFHAIQISTLVELGGKFTIYFLQHNP